MCRLPCKTAPESLQLPNINYRLFKVHQATEKARYSGMCVTEISRCHIFVATFGDYVTTQSALTSYGGDFIEELM